MNAEILENRGILSECNYKFVKSSGPGGQNVNKVNTKVELRFNIHNSAILNDDEKLLIQTKLKSRINSDGELIIQAQVKRSQLANKIYANELFLKLLAKALTKPVKRKKTKPTKASKEKRLNTKRKISEKKSSRKKVD